MAKTGRPKMIYDKQIADKILNQIELTNKSIVTICKKNKKFPSYDTIYKWIRENKEFAENYARAKQAQAEKLMDQIHDEEDKLEKLVLDDEIDPKTKNALVQTYRLKIDNLKWILCKLLPKKYGDRQQIEQTHDVSGNLKEILQKHVIVKELGQGEAKQIEDK